jgi:hypothetical protein
VLLIANPLASFSFSWVGVKLQQILSFLLGFLALCFPHCHQPTQQRYCNCIKEANHFLIAWLLSCCWASAGKYQILPIRISLFVSNHRLIFDVPGIGQAGDYGEIVGHAELRCIAVLFICQLRLCFHVFLSMIQLLPTAKYYQHFIFDAQQ